MVTRGIELRLRKLEGVGRRGLFFLAWGRTEAEIEQAVVRARRAGVTGGVNPPKDGGGSSLAVVSRRPRWPSMAGWQAL